MSLQFRFFILCHFLFSPFVEVVFKKLLCSATKMSNHLVQRSCVAEKKAGNRDIDHFSDSHGVI